MASEAEGNETENPNEEEAEQKATPETEEGGEKKSEVGEDAGTESTAAKGDGDGDESMDAKVSKATAVDTESKAAGADGDKKDSPEDELKPSKVDADDKSPAASKSSVQEGDDKSPAASKASVQEGEENQSKAASKAADADDQASKIGDDEDKGSAAATKTSEAVNKESEAESEAAVGESKPKSTTASESAAIEEDEIGDVQESQEAGAETESQESKDEKVSPGSPKKSRPTARPSRQPDQLTTQQQAKAARSLGAKEYVKKRKTSMKEDSDSEFPTEHKVSEIDPRQKISILSQHTMEELSQKPRALAPPPTRKSSMISRKLSTKKSYSSRLVSMGELDMGGTRMSTLTEYLKRKNMSARKRSLARDAEESMHRAFPDGRPSLYEQYTKHTDDRIKELSEHFTPEQMMEYRDAFYNFDDDIDGFIPIGEVPFLMRALCQNPTEEELYEWISEVDVDSLGSIDFADFLTIMKKKIQTNPIGYEEVMGAFRTFDNHDNGYLCAKELAYLMTTFGETLSEDEMADMLNEVEISEDFEVPYIEFVKKITDC